MCVAAANPLTDNDPMKAAPVQRQPDPEPEPVQAVTMNDEGGEHTPESRTKAGATPGAIGSDEEGSEVLGTEARRRRNPFLSAALSAAADTGFTPISRVTLGA
jgi:hypothetical protein